MAFMPNKPGKYCFSEREILGRRATASLKLYGFVSVCGVRVSFD